MKSIGEISRKGKFIGWLPGILTGIGVVSFIAAAIFATEATPKALKLIEEEKEELDTDELTVEETISVAWKPYTKALIFVCLGIVASVASCAMHYQYTGALLAVGTAIERGYQEAKKVLSNNIRDGDNYKKVTLETVGEEIEKQIQDKVDSLALSKNDDGDISYQNYDGNKKMWFKDMFTGQDVFISPNEIKEVITDINYELSEGNEQSINDYCDAMGLSPMSRGEDILWGDHGKAKVIFGAKWLDDAKCYIGTIRFADGYGPDGRIYA